MRSTDIETNSKPEAKERSIAYKLADKQQEISVAEFFEKNKQILGFDSRSKSLLMGVKEAVDNSLDACEEAELLPEISVKIERLEDDEYRITVEDNGPGIVHNSMANVYGRLLYGSRFHALKQSRGQQGIGISATVMYGYLTTGKPAHVISKISGEDEVAWEMDVVVDTKNNRPLKTNDKAFTWDRDHGTSVEFTIKGRYITGKQSIFEYLKNTAIVNPHASITFQDPDGKKWTFEKATEIVPIKPKEIKPHPEGMEIGDLIKYAHASKQKNVESFLRQDFSRVTKRIADEILEISEIRPKLSPGKLTRNNCADLIKAIGKVKIMAPQTDCLSPIGDTLIKKGLMHVMDGLRPDYYATPVTRAPKTANGNPFVVEAGIVYGGDIPSESQINILRFANRVPLLYQQGACAITKAISDMDWRRYGLEQRGGKGIPYGPAIILVHVASTKVPFTSEGKEAIASYPEIINEVTAALRLCARNLKSHLNKIERRSKTHAKFEIVQEILPELAKKTSEYLNRPVPNLDRTITKIMNVVWIEPTLEKLGKNDRRCTYTIYNYTNSVRNFGLHAHVPKESVNLALFTDPCFRELDDTGRAFWEIKDLQPSTSTVITFELNGEMADTFSNEDIYISGINPTIIMGADALPGDWGIKGIEITEEEDIVEDDIPEDEEEETLEDEEFEKGGWQMTEKNEITIHSLTGIVENLYDHLNNGNIPTMEVALRSKRNIEFNPKTSVWNYGNLKTLRTAKTVKGALMLLRTVYTADFIKGMLDAKKSSTLREMYYISEGWNNAKFSSQDESVILAEDLEILTGLMREDFKLRPEEDGARIYGDLTLTELTRKGEKKKINCIDDVGDSGYGIPYNVGPEKIEFKSCGAKFVIAIETGGMFDRLVENGFPEKYDALLVHLKGQPTRGTRRFMKRLNEELNLPVTVFTDGDPWSFRIYASVAYGAIKTAHISDYLATPTAQFIGITPSDILNYDLPTDTLTDKDKGALNAELSDPRFKDEFWENEIQAMLGMGKKAEQQALAKYGLDFVTDTYLPEKLTNMGIL